MGAMRSEYFLKVFGDPITIYAQQGTTYKQRHTRKHTHTHTHTHAHTLTRVSGHREKQNQARQATTHRTNKERLRDSKNRKDKKKGNKHKKEKRTHQTQEKHVELLFFCIFVSGFDFSAS